MLYLASSPYHCSPPFLSRWSHSVSACESRRLVHSRARESPTVPVVSLPEWEIMEIDQNTTAWEGEASRAIFGNGWSRYLKHRMPQREREDYNKRCYVKMSFDTPLFFCFLSQLLCTKCRRRGSMSKFWVGPMPKDFFQICFPKIISKSLLYIVETLADFLKFK